MSQATKLAVKFTYNEIVDLTSKLGPKIEEAFGPTGLGVCMVEGIPNFVHFRNELLPLAYKLATLPKEKLKHYERPENFHSKGWSCGVEQFKGQVDVSKGSFYNNPLYDDDNEQLLEKLDSKGQELRVPNVWPEDTIPELQPAFKTLGRLMVDVGAMLAYHIDIYVASKIRSYRVGTMYRHIREGDQHLGRLLHYFSQSGEQEWCGWHNDHSSLTALTAPIYMTSDGKIVQDFTDSTGGLMAKNRFADVTQIKIQKDCLAFQIGECSQIITGGLVEATPHCCKVIGGQKAKQLQLNRNTFAVFMAPRSDTPINLPDGIAPEQAMNKDAYQVPPLINRWKKNILFSEYNVNSFRAYSNY